jgi:hypothetical protein
LPKKSIKKSGIVSPELVAWYHRYRHSIFPKLRNVEISASYSYNFDYEWVDFSQNYLLENVKLRAFDPDFKYIFLKNGVNETLELGFPLLLNGFSNIYICNDDDQYDEMIAVVQNYNNQNLGYEINKTGKDIIAK